jgi:hypothetical protein
MAMYDACGRRDIEQTDDELLLLLALGVSFRKADKATGSRRPGLLRSPSVHRSVTASNPFVRSTRAHWFAANEDTRSHFAVSAREPQVRLSPRVHTLCKVPECHTCHTTRCNAMV